MISYMILSFYASLSTLIYIIKGFSVMFPLRIKKSNSVALSVSMAMLRVFLSIDFRSCCIVIEASHASANPKVSVSRTILRDLTIALSIKFALLFCPP